MRLWLFNHYAAPPEMGGGTRHYTLARELVNRGHEVSIIAANVNHFTGQVLDIPPGTNSFVEMVDGVRFIWLRSTRYRGNTVGRIWNMTTFAGRVRTGEGMRQLGAPDVIFGSSPHLLTALAAQRLAQAMRVPFVLEVRDLWPQTFVDLGHFSNRHPVVVALRMVERFLYRSADHVVTLLPGAPEYIARHGGCTDRITWIPNGADLQMVPDPAPPTGNDVFTVMYAGAHGLANGLEVILEAAARLQRSGRARVRFRLIGEGPAKSGLIASARAYRLENVSFEPHVAKREVYGKLREADAFIVNVRNSPLYRYGVSLNKFFDYMAMARPTVIASGAVNNPFSEAGAGICTPPDDPGAMAAAIEQLAAMTSAERWEMGLRGRDLVEREYDFVKLADRLEEVLYNVHFAAV